MKNLRKLSRNKLKTLAGGKRLPENGGVGGNCADMCMPNGGNGGDGCSPYGLTCGFFRCGPGPEDWGNRCM